MRPHANRACGTLGRRGAFTLIELLIVIAIIAVLAGLSASAAVAVLASQKERNTKFTMRQINEMLKKHREAVIHEAEADTNWKATADAGWNGTGTRPSAAIMAMAGGGTD